MQQSGSKYFALRPPSTLGVGSKGKKNKKHFIFKICTCFIEIKGNHACSNIVANIRPPPPPWGWGGVGSKGQTSNFSEHGHVAYQIKRNTNAAICKFTFCPYTHHWSLGWGQRSKHFFLKVVMLHIKLKGMKCS